MRLLQNLHESGIFLSVDQVDVGVHIIILKSFDSIAFLFVPDVHYFSFFLLKVRFGKVSVLLNFGSTLFMEFNE